jgi:hypothetical protein
MRFMFGMLIGMALTYAMLIYPKESKKLISETVDTVSSAGATALHAAAEATDKQLSDNKKHK